MPLPSQTTPPVRSRSHMYRRKRPKRKPVLAITILVVAAAVIVWQFLPDWGTDGPAPANAAPDGSVEQSRGNVAAPDQPGASSVVDPTLETRQSTAREQDDASTPPAIVMGEGSTGGLTREPGSPAEDEADSQDVPVSTPSVLPNVTPSPTPSPAERSAPPRSTDAASMRVQQMLANGWDLLSSNRLVEARRTLSLALGSGRLSAAEADQVRQALTDINQHLVFSPLVMEGDRFAEDYTIEGGDLLSSIVKRYGLQVDWRFIQRINNISDPSRIRAGQRIKLVTGPFHAVVHKDTYRLDLYMGEEDDRVFVRSFPVGLGEYNSTPVGLFRIRPQSKLINPQWPDPRSGRIYDADDPNNPIGERWLGLEGLDDRTRSLDGYGIHGTIEPDSIGRQASMGCVRMLAEDVEIIYEVLIEGVSTVEIRAD